MKDAKDMVFILLGLRRPLRFAVRACFGVLALTASVQAQTLQTVTRAVEYDYDATTGLVTVERVDPGLATCVQTEYMHDEYGNRRKVTVRPCANVAVGSTTYFEPRVTDNYFEAKPGAVAADNYPAGAYLTKSIARQADGVTAIKETRAEFDARFGTATKQTAVAIALASDRSRDLSTRSAYDGFGRATRSYAPVQQVGSAAPTESSIKQEWFYCEGAFKPAVKPAECLSHVSTMAVSYASSMLVNPTTGNATSSHSIEAITAYYIESTPLDAAEQVIGAKSRVHYDSLHREIAKESQSYDGRWMMTLKAYNALGMVGMSWGQYFGRDAGGAFIAPPSEQRQWTAAYDLLHRPTEQRQMWRGTAGAGNEVELAAQMSYSGLDNTATVPSGSSPDGIARSSTSRNNPIGKVTQTIDTYGATLNSAYDPVGNLVRTVDALGNTTTIEYTAGTARFKERMTDPNQGAWSYAYDALGQLRRQTEARIVTATGQPVVTEMRYDVLGRLTEKLNPSQNATWYHDKDEAGAWCANGHSRLCEAKAANGANLISREKTTLFDELARPRITVTTIDRPYTSEVTYDSLGRAETMKYPTGLTVRYGYSAAGAGRIAGVLEKVSDNASASRVFWSIAANPGQAVDARGNVIRADLGNGLGTNHVFDSISGKAFNLRTGTPAGGYANAHDHRYAYDKADNVATRQEAINQILESFVHDRLNRLSSYSAASSSDAGANRTVTMDYNAIGNLINKSDVGGYAYASARPHAPSNVGGTGFSYDDNGNVTASTGNQPRTLAWTFFNQAERITYRDRETRFIFDHGYKRIVEVATQGSTERRVNFVHPDNQGGLAYEREETRVSSTLTKTESRHYISVGGAVIAVVKTANDSGVVPADPNATNYWHKDALGSIVAVTNASGTVLERMAFDPWGRRVRDTGMPDPSVNPGNGDRGFTGHEHLDEVALIHMNGRVYDPLLAKFLSVDPVVGNPNDLQAYNRYGYVFNQPTRYADPSGNCPVCFLIFAAGLGMALDGNKYWSAIGSIMMFAALGPGGMVEAGLGAAAGSSQVATQLLFTPGASSIIAGGITGFAASGGSLEAAFTQAVFAGVTTGIGIGLPENSLSQGAGAVVAHAMVGCVRGHLSSGSCGPSAVAGAFGKLTTIGTDGMGVGPAQFVATTIAGGTASVIGGGKFANGAFQAAFGYVFNKLASGGASGQGRDRMSAEAAEAASKVLYALVPGGDAVECYVEGCSAVGWGLAAAGVIPGAKGPALLIRFGKVENQVSHAFRYIDAAGFSREAVSTAITTDLAKIASSLPQGLHNGSVVVNGTKLDYAAYKLADGTINVGRITPPRKP
jgi:RHS repeat-associated protein